MQSGLSRSRSGAVAGSDILTVMQQFEATDAGPPPRRIALDLAGNLLAATDDVRDAGDGPPSGGGAGDDGTPFHRIAREAYENARDDPSWRGVTALGPATPTGAGIYLITPVTGSAGLAGWILSSTDAVGGRPAGDGDEPSGAGSGAAARVAALAGGSVLLLDPREIRFAEASRHSVWLVTDHGRFRAAQRGMDNAQRELARHGFVRVHRSFLVNPDRVRRVDHKGNGLIALSTDYHHAEEIPVSRRWTRAVRLALGV